ncbi:lanthionine synthetase LanC family protein [Longimicrobium sp.]|uniref:lanthionine synthetase LanC family protein n=1 Tax=Longimicrobium sp. TaxID=2029185 RepID=UPI002EDAADB7
MLTNSGSGAALLDLPVPGGAPPADDDAALFLERARSIAAYVRGRAVRTRGGAVVWMQEPAAPGGAPAPMDPYLFGGSGGVALFLAALDHVEGTDAHRELVLGALAAGRRTYAGLAAQPGSVPPALPVGGFVGIGAFIYVRVRLAEWTGEPALLDEAHEATRLLTPAHVRGDARLDVLHGAAGAILALLALHAVRPGPNADGRTPLQIAAECGAHLLERRASFGGARAWPAGGGSPRPGFAHGPAGIGCALLRLHARTGDPRLRDAALEGFAYERELYDPVRRDWWHARFGRFLETQSWCTGAPGIALTRLEAAALGGGAEVQAEMRTALDVTAAHPDTPVDDLCCGNLGRADLLLSAGLSLGEPALVHTARGIVRRALKRAPRDDGFGFVAETPPRTLSLFRGVSGIGCTLLRLARPGALPSCLMME